MNKRRIQEPEQAKIGPKIGQNKNIDCYVLIISKLHNTGELETHRQQYYNEHEASTDIKNLIIDLLEVQIYSLKLYNEEERKKHIIISDYNDIFIYDLKNRMLTTKNKKIKADKLINYLMCDFFGYQIRFKIWQISTNLSEMSEAYQGLKYEPLTYKEIEDIQQGHPNFRP
jgi:hypothetical protein